MDFNATIDLIIKDLNETREIIDDLKKYPGVPVLQVELAKSKCKSAAEVIALLKSIKENLPEKKEEMILPQIENKVSEPARQAAFSAGKMPEVFEIKEETKETYVDPVPSELKKEPLKPTQRKEPDNVIMADKFSHLSGSFNEQLGNLKSDEDFTEILKSKPLSSLSEAIGINDKFLFIREIFNGDKDTYTQAILRLEDTKSISDARAVIMSFIGDNNENYAVKQLLELVKRKLH
jgi:hypothetical protein